MEGPNRTRRRSRSHIVQAVADRSLVGESLPSVPAHWLSCVIGLAMVPLLASTLSAFGRCLASATLDHAFWKSPEFWFFHLGAILWLICFLGLRGPGMVAIYVFGHEWTHALAAVCCGARVLELPVVTAKGGRVVTDRSNVVISLAPYVVPLYALLIGVGFFLANLLWRPLGGESLWLLYGLLGFAWTFHLTFTLWMMRHRQPDLEENGRLFSIVFVLQMNLFVLSLLLVLASPNVSFDAFARIWWQQTVEAWSGIAGAFGLS